MGYRKEEAKCIGGKNNTFATADSRVSGYSISYKWQTCQKGISMG